MWWLGLALFLVCIIEVSSQLWTTSNLYTVLMCIVSSEMVSTMNPTVVGLQSLRYVSFIWCITRLRIMLTIYSLRARLSIWHSWAIIRCSIRTWSLSLSSPDILIISQANYSFSGALRPLSKLIVCLVMLRGRHRGLPVAIDRAIMVPVAYETNGISEGPTMVPDEAILNEILPSEHILSPREKSPPPQEYGRMHRRRPSVMSGVSEGQRVLSPRRNDTIITIEEPWELSLLCLLFVSWTRTICLEFVLSARMHQHTERIVFFALDHLLYYHRFRRAVFLFCFC